MSAEVSAKVYAEVSSEVNAEVEWTSVRLCQLVLGKGHSTIPGAGKAGIRPKSYGDNFAVARKGFPVWPHPGYEFGKEPGTEAKTEKK